MTLSLKPSFSYFWQNFVEIVWLIWQNIFEIVFVFGRTSYYYLAENRVTIWQNIVFVFGRIK